jgi:hypothetical protein
MRRLMIIAVSLLLMSVYAVGQGNGGEEAVYVRAMLREAGAKSVTQAKTGILPTEGPLKVYVIASGQERMRADFAERLEEWNRAEGDRYGRLELVEDAAQADIILARFVGGLKTVRDESQQGMSPTNDVLVDPVSHRLIPLAKAPPHEHSTAKAFCYVAAREGYSLKVLWRGRDTVRVHDGKEGRYWELMVSSDSKSAGDRLRGKFFEMLRARTRPKG